MSECTHNCNTCTANCASRNPESFLAKLNDSSSIKNIIAVTSGKGGVGKSLVASLIASSLQKKNKKVGILDADITGPSIPKSFGITDNMVVAKDNLMVPKLSKNGIKIMSTNLLMENETDPIIWRGSLISQTVKQFYTDTYWEELDYLVVDMPPGTGDVALSVYQSLPASKVVIVASPQKLVEMIVKKSINMARRMDKNIVGIVENMAYVKCPKCNEEIYPFGKSNLEKFAKDENIDVYAKLPIDEKITNAVDNGDIESLEFEEIEKLVEKL